MSKHTPGPWTSSNQGWGDGMADVIGPNREAIARMPILVFCPSGDCQVIDDPEQQAEYSANRHLVEAAPDLLKALIDFLDDPMGDPEPCRKAIAKALGKSS